MNTMLCIVRPAHLLTINAQVELPTVFVRGFNKCKYRVEMGGQAKAKACVVKERRLTTGEIVLRFGMAVLALVSGIRLGTDTESRNILGLEKEAKLTDVKALVYLVVMDGIVACYSMVQGLRCVLSMYIGSPLCSRPLAWLIFVFDQMIAYITLAAAAAAAESAYLAERGQIEFQWIKVCDFFGRFCNQIGEGLVTAFLVSVCMITVSGMSAYHLFRLYGPRGTSVQ